MYKIVEIKYSHFPKFAIAKRVGVFYWRFIKNNADHVFLLDTKYAAMVYINIMKKS